MSQSTPFKFGELSIGECFISFPMDGDDSGHGGYRGGSYLFRKINKEKRGNASKICNNVISSMPNSMLVIKVLT